MSLLDRVDAPESVRFPAPLGLVVEREEKTAPGSVILSFPLISRRPEQPRLTPAEWEVLRNLAHGLSNREIATSRGVSVRTVANQMGQLFRKLGVHSRLDAALAAGHWTPPGPEAPTE